MSVIPGMDLQADTKPPNVSNLCSEPPALIFATSGYDHTIRFWDVILGNCVGIIQHNESQVNCMAISDNKRLLAVGGNPDVKIFDTAAACSAEVLHLSTPAASLKDHYNASSSEDLLGKSGNDLSPNQGVRNITGSMASLTTCNLAPIRTLKGKNGNIIAIGFEKTSRWLWAASEEGTIMIWESKKWELLKKMQVTLATLMTVITHPALSLFYAGDEEGWLQVWDLQGKACQFSLCLNDPANTVKRPVGIVDLALSPSTECVAAVCTDGSLYLFKVDNNSLSTASNHLQQISHRQKAHTAYITKCLFSPDSESLLTVGADHVARLWNVHLKGRKSGDKESNEPVLDLRREFTGHQGWIWDCAFSADSAYIITVSSDGTGRLWDVSTGNLVTIYAAHSKSVTCLALNDLLSL